MSDSEKPDIPPLSPTIGMAGKAVHAPNAMKRFRAESATIKLRRDAGEITVEEAGKQIAFLRREVFERPSTFGDAPLFRMVTCKDCGRATSVPLSKATWRCGCSPTVERQ